MKVTIYLSYAISLIFIVMGILILTGIPFKSANPDHYSTTRIIFGIILVIYGVFRAFKAYLTSKRKNDDETGSYI